MLTNEVKCPDCDGKGVEAASFEAVPCRRCDGKKSVPATCEHCAGKKTVEVQGALYNMNTVPCPVCHGDGYGHH